MSARKSNKNFHTIYDNKTLENMKRYYRINTDEELVEYIKRNRIVEFDEGEIIHNSNINK
jgi:hypothetical protein